MKSDKVWATAEKYIDLMQAKSDEKGWGDIYSLYHAAIANAEGWCLGVEYTDKSGEKKNMSLTCNRDPAVFLDRVRYFARGMQVKGWQRIVVHGY